MTHKRRLRSFVPLFIMLFVSDVRIAAINFMLAKGMIAYYPYNLFFLFTFYLIVICV